jgi:hypothetical protein
MEAIAGQNSHNQDDDTLLWEGNAILEQIIILLGMFGVS